MRRPAPKGKCTVCRKCKLDTQEIEARKDIGFEIIAVILALILAAVIGASIMFGAPMETEERDGRSEHSTNKR